MLRNILKNSIDKTKYIFPSVSFTSSLIKNNFSLNKLCKDAIDDLPDDLLLSDFRPTFRILYLLKKEGPMTRKELWEHKPQTHFKSKRYQKILLNTLVRQNKVKCCRPKDSKKRRPTFYYKIINEERTFRKLFGKSVKSKKPVNPVQFIGEEASN
eukprot:TRINITY_DN6156_c0_g1_i1.p1 TRINITY_DN6156_c0_g1~~TRINITY_DN6156_c0_g1_i1.p1  ORF type:complete len:155 (-),score=8.50 TRINITY_DN6156_c0_g1_i1:170-634(-)